MHVLASTISDEDSYVRVYFIDGPVVSQDVHKGCLSRGWRDKHRPTTFEELAERFQLTATETRTLLLTVGNMRERAKNAVRNAIPDHRDPGNIDLVKKRILSKMERSL